ncbi:MAG: response regulator transcription factor [Gammaproteobacteria bacterium]
MPGMFGIETARQLDSNRDVPFIFLSAYDDEDIVRQAVNEGALDFLVNPIINAKQIIPSI